MDAVRKSIGGLGNLMFKQAFLIGKMLDGEIPDVYVQSPKYWTKHTDKIKETFSNGIGKTNAVAIHIRRGDYLDTDFHTDLSNTNYYQDAVKNFPNENFLVFCKDGQDYKKDVEDREWCYKFMKSLGVKWEFTPMNNSEFQDLNLMSSCKGIIMANSSFSWWAAFLSNSYTIICPKKWFADGVHRIDLLDEWILI